MTQVLMLRKWGMEVDEAGRERGEGWQEKAVGSGLESWQVGWQAGESWSRSTGKNERTVNTDLTRNNHQSWPECKL